MANGSSDYVEFQSTLPRGERLQISRRRNDRLLFQSTLPRGERLHYCPSAYYLLLSISFR